MKKKRLSYEKIVNNFSFPSHIWYTADKYQEKGMRDMEEIPAKTIVTRTKSTEWFGIEYNMNIYRGCSHGCIYCDSRSDCYGITDFERVKVKKDALRIIRDDLRRKVKTGVVGTGSMSDPYNPLEKELELTRHGLELLSAFSFGVAIAIKSNLVTRDIDILKEIKGHSPVIVKMTVTTGDDALSHKLEPGAPPSSRRLRAVEELSGQGIFCGILLMPVLPYITDNTENIREVVRLAGEAGARFVYPSLGLTMRDTQREHLLTRLEAIFPGMEEKYRSRYGGWYRCPVPKAKELWAAFTEECNRRGLLYKMPDIISGYKMGYGDSQLSWF